MTRFSLLAPLRAPLIALGLLVVAAFPTNALAATASVLDGGFWGTHTLWYVAGAGEVNEVQVSSEGQIPTVHDSGAVIVAGAGCISVDAHMVTCTAITDGSLSLGDLGDSLSLVDTFGSLNVYGGPGADALSSCEACGASGLQGEGGDDSLSGHFLSGGPGNDRLNGTSGTDGILDGGPGNDTITAGEGSDSITPGDGDDVIDGGGGFDGLGFDSVRGPVTVNMRTGIATGAGTDTFTGIEGVYGSSRGDLLIGDEKANWLGGGTGRDIIRGGRGADHIDGGLNRPEIFDGNDRLYGGPGNDVLLGRRGNDVLDGGRGWDRLHAGGGDDLLRSRDGGRDRVRGDRGHDRARVDRGLDSVRGVEKLL